MCKDVMLVLPCLPKVPDWSNKKLRVQELDRRDISKTSRQIELIGDEILTREDQEERTRKRGTCLG